LLQEQVLVPGPVLVQLALRLHPPLLMVHESTGWQTTPLPVYPLLHVHVAVVTPVDVQTAVFAQPPLLPAQAPIPVQVLPSPV
jgi:hypothetical protein